MNFFNLHTHTFTSNPAITEMVNQYPWEFDASIPKYSIGIHPWHINKDRLESDLQTITSKLSSTSCLAVGECGLDKRSVVPMDLQIAVFEKQIALAEQFQKPLILHLVAAFDELIIIKNRLKISVPIIIHGFSKSEQLAQKLIDSNFYLSFGKYLLRNPQVEDVFKTVPNDRFFLETDTITETLQDVYLLAAHIKKMTLSEMQYQIKTNWEKLF
ncbi:TatD family hydrolase [Flavobacterium sp.]|uniref:TatD family hydrolase n=1 Tax=Flavobacterium sp. TaxID=239 RepID=UPI0025F45A2C|nr:TatD family hydrolase [Flavobacterium sp.]